MFFNDGFALLILMLVSYRPAARVYPPSTVMVCPLRYWLPAVNNTAEAISSSLPGRFAGTFPWYFSVSNLLF